VTRERESHIDGPSKHGVKIRYLRRYRPLTTANERRLQFKQIGTACKPLILDNLWINPPIENEPGNRCPRQGGTRHD